MAAEVGLGRVILAMGSNFGDIDNDGHLDLDLGTGLPNDSALVPHLTLKNAVGNRFGDVSVSSGTAPSQKGHVVGFADGDGDGGLDRFVQKGGSAPGDRAHNVPFRNPGHGRHWLDLELVGTRTNRAAIGAKVRVDIEDGRGTTRSIYLEVGSGPSYGGNSRVQHVGLDAAGKAETIAVRWPVSGAEQVFHRAPADRTIVITEGAGTYETIAGRVAK